MIITLKNYQVNKAMSEETLCFSATLYVDGAKVGTVCNRGHGGCNEYGIPGGVLHRMEEFCKQLGKDKYEPLDSYILDLIDALENRKWLDTHARKKTLFRLKGDKDGEWRTLSRALSPEMRTHIAKVYGDTVETIYDPKKKE